MKRLFVLLALAATPALADDVPMTGAEFEAYASGKTLTFAQNGQVYGIEQYLSGRRVRWAFIENDCMDGYWYESGDQICFLYDTDGPVQCWHFYREAQGLRADFVGNESGAELYEAQQSDEPLLCKGPQVGV